METNNNDKIYLDFINNLEPIRDDIIKFNNINNLYEIEDFFHYNFKLSQKNIIIENLNEKCIELDYLLSKLKSNFIKSMSMTSYWKSKYDSEFLKNTIYEIKSKNSEKSKNINNSK